MRRIALPLAALAAGLAFALWDARVTTDDNGPVALVLLVVAAAFGAGAPRRALGLGLLVGAGVPLLALLGAVGLAAPSASTPPWGTLVALVPGALGGLVGGALRRPRARPRPAA